MLFVTNPTRSSIPQVHLALSRNNIMHYVTHKACLVTVRFVVPAVWVSLLCVQACSDSNRQSTWLARDRLFAINFRHSQQASLVSKTSGPALGPNEFGQALFNSRQSGRNVQLSTSPSCRDQKRVEPYLRCTVGRTACTDTVPCCQWARRRIGKGWTLLRGFDCSLGSPN